MLLLRFIKLFSKKKDKEIEMVEIKKNIIKEIEMIKITKKYFID